MKPLTSELVIRCLHELGRDADEVGESLIQINAKGVFTERGNPVVKAVRLIPGVPEWAAVQVCYEWWDVIGFVLGPNPLPVKRFLLEFHRGDWPELVDESR